MQRAPGRRAVVFAAAASCFVLVGPAMGSAAGATGPRFSAPIAVHTGLGPSAVAAADFNSDGKPDLATAEFDSRSMSVLFGNGDGTFTGRTSYRVKGDQPTDILSADINGDNASDVITTGFSGVMTVFINSGNGRFRRERSYRDVNSVAAADVNRDGVVDLLAAQEDFGVWLGTGSGRFAPLTPYAGRDAARGIASGDFNGDGNPDVALASNLVGQVWIRLGSGNGGFGPGRPYRLGGFDTFSVGVTDLNRDGRMDVIAATTKGAAVLYSNGDGTFGSVARYVLRGERWDVVAADFDGDANPDLAVSSSELPFAVRAGRADGTFAKAQILPLVAARGEVVADFNQDGRPDLAFGTFNDYAQVVLNWTGLSGPPCVVLDVRRLRSRLARHYLHEGGCRVGKARRRYSRRVRKGLVISQNPATGAVLPRGTSVDVVISRGRRR